MTNSLSLTDQASADNAKTVGLMAEDFANKGWSLAQHGSCTSNSFQINPKGHRKYSTSVSNSTTSKNYQLKKFLISV